MVISIRDANGRTKNTVTAAGLIGGITAVSKSKNTLILQFTPAGELSILDVMAGKSIKENQIQSIYNFSDDGLDGIAIRADSNDLSKEHFDECVTPLLEKDNMLDVLKPTKSENYRDVLSEEIFENIIKGAKAVYEYVYIILPRDEDDKKLVDMVMGYTDEDLVIVPQGPKQEVDLSNQKTNLVIINYEPSSKFDLRSMKKAYGVKKLYTIPYSVACRDARISETLLDFIILNRKDLRTDDNYSLFSSLNTLIERYVTNKDDDEEEEVKLEEQTQADVKVQQPQDVLPEDSVQEVIVRKGLFKKKEKKIMINM